MSEAHDIAEAIAGRKGEELRAWRVAMMRLGQPFEVLAVARHATPYWQFAQVIDARTGQPIERWQAANAEAGWVDLMVIGSDGRVLRDPHTGRQILQRKHLPIRIVLTPAAWMADLARSSTQKPNSRT